MTTELNQILAELADLYGELKRDAGIGDVNPESVARALLETMKLFGRYVVAVHARPYEMKTLPEVTRE